MVLCLVIKDNGHILMAIDVIFSYNNEEKKLSEIYKYNKLFLE